MREVEVDVYESGEIKKLIASLTNDEPSEAATSARSLGKACVVEAVPELRRVLVSTSSFRLRNACAIALSDLADEGCVPIIAALLEDPATAGQRGSLLYALEPFDCRSLFPLLVEIAAFDGFEARHTAFDLLCAVEGDVDPGVVKDAMKVAQSALETATDERRNSNLDLVELLEEFNRPLVDRPHGE
jgi:HEAT repeat protein